jgi:hypothetical protein
LFAVTHFEWSFLQAFIVQVDVIIHGQLRYIHCGQRWIHNLNLVIHLLFTANWCLVCACLCLLLEYNGAPCSFMRGRERLSAAFCVRTFAYLFFSILLVVRNNKLLVKLRYLFHYTTSVGPCVDNYQSSKGTPLSYIYPNNF